ncbi:MAG: preprotein translocase subunit SecE [Nitriliruptorales bacterium]|nr:preprotein translocase subunit SecE [Nitriliruptorales bacterium]
MNRETDPSREDQRRPATRSSEYDFGDRERSSPAQFLREVRSELKKVAWPTRREVVAYTIVVLVVTTALVMFVWALDWVFARAVLNLFE